MVETVRSTDLFRPAAPLHTPTGLPTESEVMAHAGGENFTVASRLLPAGARADLLAFYGYARLVDQLGDDYAGDRSAALDWVEAQLDTALLAPAGEAAAGRVHPLVARAAAAVARAGTGAGELRSLIEANRADQVTSRYATFADLRGYCRLSAEPVGRLVLLAFGASTPERVAWSDAICTGLQLAEHWQDVAEDARAGRIYLPLEDLDRFGVAEAGVVDLARRRQPAPAAVRGLVVFEAARARSLLSDGAPLVRSLSGRARLAVAGFVAGGLAALDAIAANGFDPFAGAPRPRRVRVARHAARILTKAAGA